MSQKRFQRQQLIKAQLAYHSVKINTVIIILKGRSRSREEEKKGKRGKRRGGGRGKNRNKNSSNKNKQQQKQQILTHHITHTTLGSEFLTHINVLSSKRWCVILLRCLNLGARLSGFVFPFCHLPAMDLGQITLLHSFPHP